MTSPLPNPHLRHGTIVTLPGDFFGYFAWPTVARLDNGDLVVVASGLRHDHVDPFGRTVFMRSRDEGRTWTSPTVINDLPIDDRDAGIVDLGNGRLLVSWFTSDTRQYPEVVARCESSDPEVARHYANGFRKVTDDAVSRWLGSWTRLSTDGGDSWSEPRRAPVTAPHGPITLPEDEALLYFGKSFTGSRDATRSNGIAAYRSEDLGRTWALLGRAPVHPNTVDEHYHEPHVVALADGRLLGLIRIQDRAGAPSLAAAGIPHFSMMQTTSDDGGRTWSTPEPLGFHGSPPHLLRHSSGAVVATYGYRLTPFGERAIVSYDGGTSWDTNLVLRDDGPDTDLGYPSSVELSDGALFTVYYQKRAPGELCSLLWTRWELPVAP